MRLPDLREVDVEDEMPDDWWDMESAACMAEKVLGLRGKGDVKFNFKFSS